jgi:tetratricopeptide (TPR) repeat protein
VELFSSLLSAYTALEKGASADSLQLHIKRLEDLKQHFPVFRMLYIVLGRLYRKIGNLDQAIGTLSEFIGNKEKAGKADDADAAAAYYNRACYRALKAGRLTESARQTLLEAATADLGEAIKRSSEYKEYAKADPDLEPIKGSIS